MLVTINHFLRSQAQVEVYEYTQPTNNVTYNSMLYATTPSPMAHVIVDYRILRQAQIRQAHADAWNTEAKLICSFHTQKNAYTVNEGNPITNDWTVPQNRLGVMSDINMPTELESNVYARDAVAETCIGAKKSQHKPVIYSLPKNTTLEQVHNLQPIQNIPELHQRLAKDISSIMGVPYELISGGYSTTQGSKKSEENTRIFVTNMMEVCRHLCILMQNVYCATYGGAQDTVAFSMRPTPRIAIDTVEDLKVLLEAGVIEHSNAMEISNMLLGVELKQGAGKIANAGGGSKQYMTPAQINERSQVETAARNKIPKKT